MAGGPGRRGLLAGAAALALGGCAVARFDQRGADDEAAYVAEHPYYAEFSALSQIKKKQGFGADIRGEIGGHAVFYLNGVRRRPGYPVLELGEVTDGVGLSMNAHFANAKWVAAPGRDFFFSGSLPPGGGLSRADYAQVQAEAKRRGVYDGVVFHEWVFDAMPPGWTREDWRYEMSIATDYAISLGRGRYGARIPVGRAQMERMVAFLNAENDPYREGRRIFEWSVFNDNCIHLAHNALAAAGLWERWPTERFLPVAFFDFPVPKNEFVNVMRRTNDSWPPDPGAVYADLAGRDALLHYGVLPASPGALAEAQPPRTPNAIYETELKLIFYDEPTFGHYQERFDAIFSQTRYTQPAANRAWFVERAAVARAGRRPLAWWLAQTPYRDDAPGFTLVYDRYYRLVDALLA